jgi:hypothetical protein
LDQKKQAKFHWLQDPGEIIGDNLNNIKPGTSRHFKIKRRKYLKDKIDELATNKLATNSKSKNIETCIEVINDFKRGYQPRCNLVKDENGDLLADPHNIVNRWKNYFSVIEGT